MVEIEGAHPPQPLRLPVRGFTNAARTLAQTNSKPCTGIGEHNKSNEDLPMRLTGGDAVARVTLGRTRDPS